MQIKNILTILTSNFPKYGPRMKLFKTGPVKKTSKVRKQSKARRHRMKKETRMKLEVKVGP